MYKMAKNCCFALVFGHFSLHTYIYVCTHESFLCGFGLGCPSFFFLCRSWPEETHSGTGTRAGCDPWNESMAKKCMWLWGLLQKASDGQPNTTNSIMNIQTDFSVQTSTLMFFKHWPLYLPKNCLTCPNIGDLLNRRLLNISVQLQTYELGCWMFCHWFY